LHAAPPSPCPILGLSSSLPSFHDIVAMATAWFIAHGILLVLAPAGEL